MNNFSDLIELADGKKIPSMGFGTYKLDNENLKSIIFTALDTGYRHFDCADLYENQKEVGAALNEYILEKKISREELYIVNKVPESKMGYNNTIECCLNSLKEMNLDYFDLYLIHNPNLSNKNWRTPVIDTWRAMEFLYENGYIKSIGVSNFAIKHLEFLLPKVKYNPVINQVEIHPQHQKKEIVEFCRKNKIQLVSWGSLNQGKIFKNKTFLELAQKYQCSPAQLAIYWACHNGIIPLSTSTKPERIIDFYNAKNLTINDNDMELLNSLDGGEYSGWDINLDAPEMVRLDSINKILYGNSYSAVYTLFGIIPFLRVTYSNFKKKVYLFNILILKIKMKKYKAD